MSDMTISKGTKLSLLLISLTVLFMAALMSGMIKSNHWNITNIDIQAEFKRVNSEQIRLSVAAFSERSFFKADANKIRENLLSIPWVQHVTVNKKWPNTLLVRLVEHKAVAVWNNNQLLNEKGEIFEVDSIDDLSELPQIVGKDSYSKMVWEKFTRYNRIMKVTGFDIRRGIVSNREDWILTLSNGTSLKLGTEHMDAKLVRLADTWNKLIKLNKAIPEYIDLRYTNGYTVKWPKSKKNINNRIDTEFNNKTKKIEINDVAQLNGNEKING